jgi:NADP-dependent 3-hydroxy acid dehydrogenase YdfG
VARFPSVVVVGASSGIGAEIVRYLAADGSRVAAVARRLDRLDSLAAAAPNKVFPIAHDVTDYASVPVAFQEATRAAGGLDLLVIATGVMPAVGAHEYDFAKDRLMFETNLLGCAAWLDEAAHRMEETRKGAIVVIGSVAGDRGRKGQPAYNASKAGLHAFAEAIRNRLAPMGVAVATVKPGPTATDMTKDLNMGGLMPVHEAARKIVALAGKTGEFYLKPTHRVIFGVIRNLPSWLMRRLPL